MKRSYVVEIIGEVIDDISASPLPRPIDEDTPLFGNRGLLDSLGLVAAILDVEQRLVDDGLDGFVIDHDRAMSRPVTPFLTIGTFADYVAELLEERGAT
jgi:acyl carrier protein